MKRFISVVLMLALALCVVACGNKENPNEINLLETSGDTVEKPIVKYFDEANLDKFAQTQTLELPEDTTTGYEWIYIVDDAEVVELIRDEFVLAEGLDSIDGGSGERVCELKGLSEGETIVYFEYVNPSAEVIESLESVKFYVEVNANNEIAITDEVH